MKNQKLKIGIICAAIALLFYLLGSFVGWPVQNDKLSGDIGKAKKSSSTVVKIDRDALQEKMLSDTAYCQKTLATVGMMQLHAKQFGALLVMTDAVAKDEKTLQSSLEEMQKVKETVKNATAAIDIFADDMVRLSKGEKVNGFEQDYNNAMLGFSMLQRCSNVAVDFAQNVRDSLSLLAEANKKDIETIYTEWVTFAYADALMNNDKLRAGYIGNLFFTNVDGQLGVVILPTNSETLQAQREDQLGIAKPVSFKNSEDQLGRIWRPLNENQLAQRELLDLERRCMPNEQMQSFFDYLDIQNEEQLKAIFGDAQELNIAVIVVTSNGDNNLGLVPRDCSNSENNLGVIVHGNSTELPCVEMLNVQITKNQDNLQQIITDMDVLGATAIYGSRGSN